MVANIDKPNGGILERFSWAWPTPTTLRPLGITAYPRFFARVGFGVAGL
jgi:hypothetical protein